MNSRFAYQVLHKIPKKPTNADDPYRPPTFSHLITRAVEYTAQANSLESRFCVQVYVDCVALDGLLEILQMLPVADTAVARDLQWQDSVLILALNELDHLNLGNCGLHRDHVVARLQDEVGKDAVADAGAVNSQIHSYIAKVERHDGGVGNADVADHVGAVGKDFV
jgi:hypothetical protein